MDRTSSVSSLIEAFEQKRKRLIDQRDDAQARLADIDERLAALELASTLQQTGRDRAVRYAAEIICRVVETDREP